MGHSLASSMGVDSGTSGHFYDEMLRSVLWYLIVFRPVFALRTLQVLRCCFWSGPDDVVDSFGTLNLLALLWLEKKNWSVVWSMADEHETTCLPFFKLIAIAAVLIFPFVVAYKDIARVLWRNHESFPGNARPREEMSTMPWKHTPLSWEN